MTKTCVTRRLTRNATFWVRSAIITLACGVVAGLTGCSVLLSGPTPERTERPTVVVPDEVAVFDPDASAEENQTFFLQTLQVAAGHEGQYTSRAFAQYFIDAGFDPQLMQVSQDRTRTDLEPESMFISARFDGECLVGQVVTADRSFVGEVVPAVGPNEQLCLIGETVPITE